MPSKVTPLQILFAELSWVALGGIDCSFWCGFFCWGDVETESHCAAQASLELSVILLPQPAKC